MPTKRRNKLENTNTVTITGNLTRDIELKYLNSGSVIGKISVAVNSREKKEDEWIDYASFFDVTIWGKRAETLTQFLTKGKKIAVTGRLRQSRWGQDGATRSRVEIIAEKIELLSPREQQADYTPGAPPAPPSSGEFNDDIPF
jgi:single-strand DNA-binding protein